MEDREKIKAAINSYQTTKKRSEFVKAVGKTFYTAEEVWFIIDQLYDLGEIVRNIDFKDLY